MIKTFATALAALAVIAPSIGSAATSANPAASLSLSSAVRAGAPGKSEDHAMGTAATVGIVFVLAAVTIGIAAGGDDNSDSN